MKFARDHGHGDEMLCPCSLCLNLIRHPQSVVHAHINTNRMSNTYTRWTSHGEDKENGDDNAGYESDNDDENENDDNGHNDADFADMYKVYRRHGREVMLKLIYIQIS